MDPDTKLPATWLVSNSSIAARFSATCYLTARHIDDMLWGDNVPIGLICEYDSYEYEEHKCEIHEQQRWAIHIHSPQTTNDGLYIYTVQCNVLPTARLLSFFKLEIGLVDPAGGASNITPGLCSDSACSVDNACANAIINVL